MLKNAVFELPQLLKLTILAPNVLIHPKAFYIAVTVVPCSYLKTNSHPVLGFMPCCLVVALSC